MSKIYPSDRIELTNIKEHNLMIQAINDNDDLSKTADANATLAVNTANTAKATADTAKNTADSAKQTATGAKDTADANTSAIETTNIAVGVLQNALKSTLTGMAVSADGSTVVLTLTRQDGGTIAVSMPVASAIQAGVMNASTYKSMTGLDARITALETKPQAYIVTLPSTSPTSSEIDSAYHTQYPDAPYPAIGNTTIRDVTKALSYTYSTGTATWIEDNNPTEPTATNTTLGVVMGTDGTTLGKIMLETDGTMSVVGWDALTGRVTNIEGRLMPIETFDEDEAGISLGITKDSAGNANIQLKNSKAETLNSVDILNVENTSATALEACAINKTQYLYLKDRAKNITISTSDPSGGSDGDIWIKYTA